MVNVVELIDFSMVMRDRLKPMLHGPDPMGESMESTLKEMIRLANHEFRPALVGKPNLLANGKKST